MRRWAQSPRSLRREARSVDRRLREARMFARAMASKHHPIVAHIVPIRRCNLACTCCNEFEAVSAPAPLAEMHRRIDRLAVLGTTIITIIGGEPARRERNPQYRPPVLLHALTWMFLDGPASRALGKLALRFFKVRS